ncbi:uncharacterized protein LOC133716325 [Rosa rugosa]|uniref:uncharacterized protein LOC133716325 n=1 Tax=Rosa rugosa TaxID=74645 RepID=UPI002B40AF27|nr:uncharacterized protein LOC133716325 [Rosa rugosa]
MAEDQVKYETLKKESIYLLERKNFKGAMLKEQDALGLSSNLEIKRLSALTEVHYAESMSSIDVEENDRVFRNSYGILGIGIDSFDQETLKKKYRDLAKLVHLDKNSLDGVDKATKIVIEAYKCLENEEEKRRYDKEWKKRYEKVWKDQFRRKTDKGAGAAGEHAAGGSTSFEAPTGGGRHAGVGGGSAGAGAPDSNTSFEAPTASATTTHAGADVGGGSSAAGAAGGSMSFEIPTASAVSNEAMEPRRNLRKRKNADQSGLHDNGGGGFSSFGTSTPSAGKTDVVAGAVGSGGLAGNGEASADGSTKESRSCQSFKVPTASVGKTGGVAGGGPAGDDEAPG